MAQRIPYIDLAKGICILLVVLSHCEVFLPIGGLTAMRMPLYFTLSGLFFKDYGGLDAFVVKKANKLLVPFLFFYLVGCLCFYAGKFAFPALLKNDFQGITDIVRNGTSFNTPIWFLLCLFWCNLWFALIRHCTRRLWLQALIVAIMGAAGVACDYWQVPTSLNLTASLSAMPFFFFGYFMATHTTLLHSPASGRSLAIGLVGLALAFGITEVIGEHYIYYYHNRLTGNALLAYLLGAIAVVALLMVCKSLRRLPILSYAGRYSIIILATHYLWLRAFHYGCQGLLGYQLSPWLMFVLVFATSMAMIPLCRRFLPHVCAQKELIPAPRKPITT